MRNLFLVVSFIALSAGAAHSQMAMVTSDVLNIANLTQLISQVYAMYDQISATIEQVQNTYQQIKNQIDMVKNMGEKFNQFKDNLGDIDLTNIDGFLKFRDQYSNIISYINYNMDLLNNIYDTFTKKKISFGGKNYTFGGLIGMKGSDPGTNIFDLPRNIAEYMSESAKEGMAGYAGKLTREQQTALMQKYGLSPRNYYKLRLVEQTASVAIDSLLAQATSDAEELRARSHLEQVQLIEDMKKIAGDSLVSQMEVNTEAFLKLKDDIQQVINILNKANSFNAHNELVKQTREEALAEQRLQEAKQREEYEHFRQSAIQLGDW